MSDKTVARKTAAPTKAKVFDTKQLKSQSGDYPDFTTAAGRLLEMSKYHNSFKILSERAELSAQHSTIKTYFENIPKIRMDTAYSHENIDKAAEAVLRDF
jgi:hypothetical protein